MDFFWSVNYDFGQPCEEKTICPDIAPLNRTPRKEPSKKKKKKQKYNNSVRTRMSRGRR